MTDRHDDETLAATERLLTMALQMHAVQCARADRLVVENKLLLAEVRGLCDTIERVRAEVPDLKDWLREFGASEGGIRHSFAVLDAALGPAGAARSGAPRECRGCSNVAPADGKWCATCIAEEAGPAGADHQEQP